MVRFWGVGVCLNRESRFCKSIFEESTRLGFVLYLGGCCISSLGVFWFLDETFCCIGIVEHFVIPTLMIFVLYGVCRFGV